MIAERINSWQRLWTSHVLLYHSTFRIAPENIHEGLHNVTPDELHRQLAWFKRYFDFVTVDDAVTHRRTGTVAVTFDDAYDCIFTEALPVLESLHVPCTVFINGNSLSGKAFWRDKIRFLMNSGLVDDFLDFYSTRAVEGRLLNRGNFYRMTKSPRINSGRVDTMIDRFLESVGQSFSEMSYCVRDASRIPRGPLLTVGNHSFNHYVLSSLGEDEQEREILDNQAILSGLGVPVSKVFSVPFGGAEDFNRSTVKILRKLGYTGFL
jgi:peptidoglycan/xylan/chitin deacetylase (PgdA/CDA1 family)